MGGGLAGKVAIVTGGNSGIGAATVMRFVHEGAKVAIVARREREGLAVQRDALEAGGEARFIACDVTDRAALEAAAQRTVALYGGVQIVVNNAGGGLPDPFPQPDDDAFERTVRLNLTSAYILSRACWPHLIAAGGGTIVNVSSLAAVTAVSPHQQSIMPFFPSAGYMASKAGLEGLTRFLASAGAAHNIRVNAVRPGAVLTPQATRLRPGHHVFERVHEEIQLTAGSGAPEDVANAIYFLASGESKFVNAQVLSVDGGAVFKV
ncbi:MAG TPA: SDR family NAD(P)-dependent oxidoreductase [Dehalococcoidia bacterium]|nr:SDR family NAD(P)-dependent oxidoreductase [Dehalococcoidia bacterium]